MKRRLGDDLRSAREMLGESQEDFAKRFGVDQSTVHRWESIGISDHGMTRVAVETILAEIMLHCGEPS